MKSNQNNEYKECGTETIILNGVETRARRLETEGSEAVAYRVDEKDMTPTITIKGKGINS